MPQEKLVNIKLSDIRPNPNRDLKFNPFNENKITALMASIGETGFWTNVIVRKSPDGKGYEQAYGHHRIEAARRSGIKEADFVVRDLDENMMLKMMELENQEDYRYCPLSLLESVKAVVNALAAGRIAPFYRVEDAPKGITKEGNKWKAQAYVGGKKTYLGTFSTPEEATEAYRNANRDGGFVRYAPSFVPAKVRSKAETSAATEQEYTAADIGEFLGRKSGSGTADAQVRAALDALYLLEVKALTTGEIKDLTWMALGKLVADRKRDREREFLRTKKTAAEVAAIAEASRKLREEQKAKEKQEEEEHKALVKKLAEAKREEDKKKAKELKDRIEEQEAESARQSETFDIRKVALEARTERIEQEKAEAKEEDKYLPIVREVDCIVHLLERKDVEERVKALARKPLNANDRQRLRNAAINAGAWYTDWVAEQFLPPLSTKANMTEYKRREAAKRAFEERETK
jgi:hypothetical protein